MKKSFLTVPKRIYNIAKFVLFAWFSCIPITILSILINQIYQPIGISPFYEQFVMSWVPPLHFDSTSNSHFAMILSILSTATNNFLANWQKVVVLSVTIQLIFFDGRGVLLAYLPLPKWIRDGPPLDLDDSDLPALEPDPRLLHGLGGDLDLTHAEFQFVRRDESSPSPRSEPAVGFPLRDEYVFHSVYGTIPREVRDLWEYQELQQEHEVKPTRRKLPPIRGSSGNSAQNSPIIIDRKS